MRTFSIITLGCKVNQYESQQIAALLRGRGLRQVDPEEADLRVVNTCSVTTEAAGKSRQTARRQTRLPVSHAAPSPCHSSASSACMDPLATSADGRRARVLVTGCWATSDPHQAAQLPGVDAVVGHHQNVASELDRLLARWEQADADNKPQAAREVKENQEVLLSVSAVSQAGGRACESPDSSSDGTAEAEPGDSQARSPACSTGHASSQPPAGAFALPLLDARHTGHQRAFLKVQDGCDAHCTYCIIPRLRSNLWSKPLADAVTEAQSLVDAGHAEIVLTGIFLGAFGQATALRRRQSRPAGGPLGELVDALCTRVRGLRRLRLSSLEPGDLTPELIAVFRSHAQLVPHFHLPLQSGSDRLLRRMNRQYTRDDFLHMADAVNNAFDRPAFTTDIIVGFPGEQDPEFAQTLDVVQRVRFIHIHAFPFSPRPGTAAARWTRDLVRGPVVNQRIARLREGAQAHSFAYRQNFLGETAEVWVERPSAQEADAQPMAGYQHGRCERYFAVHFPSDRPRVGDAVKVRINRVTPEHTIGSVM